MTFSIAKLLTAHLLLALRKTIRFFYSKLGLSLYGTSGRWRNHFQIGGKYPLYTQEKLPSAQTGYDDDVTLSPGKRVSGFAKWQTHFMRNGKPKINISLYYDSFRFSDSAPAGVTVNGVCPTLSDGRSYCAVYQPKSNMDVIGAQIGYHF